MASSPMRTISLRTIAAHKLRLLLTVMSVLLGTAFIAGSSMFTSSLSASFTTAVSSAFKDVDLMMTSNEQTPQGIPLEVIQQLRARPDIKGVAINSVSQSIALSDGEGNAVQSINTTREPQAIALDPDRTAINGANLMEGTYPVNTGEVAINKNATKNAKIKVGDTITVLTPNMRTEKKVTGIYEAPTDVVGAVNVLIPEADYLPEFTTSPYVSGALISLTNGGSQDSVKQSLQSLYPAYSIETGKKLEEEATKQIKQGLSFINYFLWAFAGIALLVGTFIISNTFAMIVAQRNKEFALLRSIGTSQSQITKSVIFEATIIGIIGSVLGIFAGIGLSKGIMLLILAKGFDFPQAGFGISTTGIVAPLVVGIVVTILSAWAPARRAGAVRPIQAMRSGDQSSNNSLLVRTIFGGIMLVSGLLFVLIPVFWKSIGGTGLRSSLIGFGALLIIIGMWLAGPALSLPLVGGLGRIIGAPFGVIGKLAATNSYRNPRRTASTAFALTLGLMLVSSIGMLGATVKKTTEDQINTQITSDFILSNNTNSTFVKIPSDLPERVSKIEGVQSVNTIFTAPIMVDGSPLFPQSYYPISPVSNQNPADVSRMTMKEGSSDLSNKDGILLSSSAAKSKNLKVGDILPAYRFDSNALAQLTNGSTEVDMKRILENSAGVRINAPIVGIYEDSQVFSDGIISYNLAQRLVSPNEIAVQQVFVNSKNGANEGEVRKKIDDAVSKDLVVTVQTKSDLAGQQASTINKVLHILYGLLGLAVIVAILGIINTLALSVIERRQEIGMLRAVGTHRRQVRTMIYVESAVIALFGSILGAAVGLGLGWAFISTLSDSALSKVVIPWTQVGIMIVGSGFIGVLAAVWPGHRAARTKPLEAIRT